MNVWFEKTGRKESGERMMKKRKLAIFFPGGKYGTQAPLFYYADLVMAKKGYEVLEISYDDLAVGSSDWINQTREQIWGRLKQIDFSAYADLVMAKKGYEVLEISYDDLAVGSSDWINQTREQIWGRLKQIDFSAYGEIVLVAKSIGTVLAGWIREKINKDVKVIFLTPLKGAFEYMDQKNSLVIAGTLDRLLAKEELAEYCQKNGICFHQFEGAGHAIVNRKDPIKSAEILTSIVKLYDAFIPD